MIGTVGWGLDRPAARLPLMAVGVWLCLLLGLTAAEPPPDETPPAVEPAAAPAAEPAAPKAAAPASEPAVVPAAVAAPAPLALAPNGGEGTQVLVIPIKDEIGPVLLFAVRRAFRNAEKMPNLSAVILDMDTPGGRVDITEEIIDRIRASKVPVFVFVNPRAYSAGAIISLACKGIYMAPGSNIGAAAPILMNPSGGMQEMPDRVEEKISSVLRALVRGLAEENGYDPELAMAFVDQDVEVKIGETVVNRKGELLVLTAQEAVRIIPPRTKPLLATAVVKDLTAVKAALGLQNAVEVDMTATASEKVARWLTLLTPLLMIGFLLGFYVEINTPGFGAAGTIAVCCLVVMLFGHYVAGLAGYEEIALIGLGVALLIIELFFIPGFGITGLLGIGCILTGLFLVMLPSLPGNLPVLPGTDGITRLTDLDQKIGQAFLMLVGVLAGAGVGMWALARWLPRIGPFSQLVLRKSSTAEAGYVGVDVETPRQLIGKRGIALTALRPAGVARIGDQRLDVVTSGDYLEKGQAVVIKRVNGPRIEVEAAPSQDAPTDSPR